jgi:hypothetical protein
MTMPFILCSTKSFLQAAGLKVEEENYGMDTTLHIKSGKKEIALYMGNLFLEVATVDRDERPLRFDERLCRFDYFIDKVSRAVLSKLKILFILLGHEDIDEAMESITDLAADYERIRIVKLDNLRPQRF